MFVVLGATEDTGEVVASALLAQGRAVQTDVEAVLASLIGGAK